MINNEHLLNTVYYICSVKIRYVGIAERKEREKQDIKDLILFKAKEIMSKDGQEGLSIRKIANEIEYSPATIYLHFKDKDEILFQMMNKGFSLMTESMGDIFQIADPLERIYQIGKRYIAFGVKHWDWYDLMFNSPKPMNHIERCEVQWGAGQTMYEFIVFTCGQIIQKLDKPKLEEKSLALQLWATVHGLVNLSSTQRLCVVEENAHSDDDKQRIIDLALDSMMVGLFDYKK